MKVYLAAQYARRDELREYRDILEKMNIKVTSRWLNEKEPLDGNMTHREESWYRDTATIDLEDVDAADAVIFFAENPLIGVPRGGRHVEFGYALGLKKPIFVIGPKENVFHYLQNPFWIRHYETLDAFITAYQNYQEYEEARYTGD